MLKVSARVLLLSQEVHCLPPVKGAAVEQWIEAVARRMRHFEPHLVSVPHPSRPDIEVDGQLHYHRIRMSALYKRLFRKLTRLDPWPYIDRVVQYARKIQPDIVHVHNAPQFVDRLCSGLPHARIVLHMHNEKTDHVRSPVAALIGCSRYIRDWYCAHGMQASRFAVLDNGVDLAAHQSAKLPQFAQALRHRYDVPSARFVVMYVGRISPEKGPDLAVEAMRQLDQERYHLVLVGEWPKGDPHRSERVRFANQLQGRLRGLSHTVIDVVPPDQMPALYGLGDLILIPSRFEEPFSMVAIEAMAARLPVMAIRRGGMAEYMIDGVNAMLMEPAASASQIAGAIERAVLNPDRLESMASRARQLVEDRFGWEKVAQQTEKLYGEVLGASSL